MTMDEHLRAYGERALEASRALALLTSRKKNAILEAMADELEARRETIQTANKSDVERAREDKTSPALIDRLTLTDARMNAMIKGLREVVALKDPVGQRISRWIRPNGLVIQKVRVPIGVIALIYEARPNVTADAASLCFKTSNAVLLRGGSSATASNRAIADALQAGGERKGLPPHSIQLIDTPDRDAIRALVQLEGLVDLVIPRGGEGLIRAVVDMARVPVIKHYKGVCHVYVDASADTDKALDICENAKCQRPGVCNAMETLLVHADIAKSLLPRLAERLRARGVDLRGDPEARKLVPEMEEADEEDWYAEYLDLVLAIRVIADVREAVRHINHYGSHHSDAIIAEKEAAQRVFTREVDSAAVFVNASTRFSDGGEFGMGAEIGISTDKLHARGPMGLEELTTYKYVISGKGQIR